MQKVVGSSPISRLREARSWSGFFRFLRAARGVSAEADLHRTQSWSTKTPQNGWTW
jgi:hypothetical protein